MWMPVFPVIFEHLVGNLLSVDGSVTHNIIAGSTARCGNADNITYSCYVYIK